MTLPGLNITVDEALGKFGRLLALKYYRVSTLIESGEVEEHPDCRSVVKQVASLRGQELVDNGTTFFWYYVHLLFTEIKESRHSIAMPVRNGFLIHLFDSFFGSLVDDATVQFKTTGGRLCLPRLNISTLVPRGRCTLRKMSARELRIEHDGGDQQHVVGGSGHEASTVAVSPSSHLMLTVTGVVHDSIVQESAEVLTPAAALAVKRELREAMDLISTADHTFIDNLERLIHWYIPVTTPDVRTVHNSFSVNTLVGAIFLSRASSPLVLAEAMLHEYYHNELWMVMHLSAHVRSRSESSYYSPWRDDARPTIGLYHAIYVYSRLLAFFESCEAARGCAEYRAAVRFRRESVYFQLRTALRVLRHEDLTEVGQSVVSELTNIVDRHGRDLSLTTAPVPEPQRLHWMKWVSQHGAATLPSEALTNPLIATGVPMREGA